MKRHKLPWTILIFVCATFAIYGRYAGKHGLWIVYVFKPTTTILILLLALSGSNAKPRYRRGIVSGLLFSLAGDIFLMLPSDLFVAGLASFLAAHICYLIAFTSDAPFARPIWPYFGIGAAAACVATVIWPGVIAGLKIPIVLYTAALGTMSAQSISRWGTLGSLPSRNAAIGGILFVLSDSLLAIDRFAFPFYSADAVVLVTYWTAQTLIAHPAS